MVRRRQAWNFIPWSAYFVPARVEPIGALGPIAVERWFVPTIRIEGSLAQQYHRRVHNDACDDSLDAWRPANSDPARCP